MRLKHLATDFRVDEVLRLPPPDRHGPFALYRLHKRGIPTLDAAAQVARLFGVAPRDVHVAGLKDARAQASQVVSVKLAGEGLPAIPGGAGDSGLRLEPIHRAARSIESDDIIANRFEIIVRDLGPEAVEPLPARIAAVLRDGVPGYFDDQRLGGASPERGFVAKLLSEGKAEDALRLLISRPSPKDPRQERLEKKAIAARWGAWGELAREVKGESAPVVRRLANDPTDPIGALRGLDVRLRGLLVQQYQSWLWNEAAAANVRAACPRERRFDVMYRGGTLVFWRAIEDDALRASLAAREVPLETFPLPEALGVTAKPGARALVLRPHALAAAADAPDECFPGRRMARLSMELPRGAYATLVAKRLFHEPAVCAPRPQG